MMERCASGWRTAIFIPASIIGRRTFDWPGFVDETAWHRRAAPAGAFAVQPARDAFGDRHGHMVA